MSDPDLARYLEWRLTHPPMMGGSDEAENEEATAEQQAEPVEAAAEATTPPPWGEDFNPERAWNTIVKQRDREKELEAEAKELHRLRNDPEAQKEFLESLGFEVPDDEPDDETVEDDPITPRLSALEQKLQEREAAEAAKQFEDHLDELAKGKEVELTKRQRKQILRDSLEAGFSPEATEQAFNELVEELSDYERRAIEKYTGTKKSPAVPPSSKSATQTPNLDDAKERQAWLKERANQLANQ